MMLTNHFTPDVPTTKELTFVDWARITDPAAILTDKVAPEIIARGDAFAKQIRDGFVSDFEKTPALEAAGKVEAYDRMAHVSTFLVIDGMIYMTYYANTKEPLEDPLNQTARFVYCPVDDVDNKVFLDIQGIGDVFDGKPINMVYDTILMRKDEDTLYILWTARVEENYYRFYRPFTMSTKTLGEVCVNSFKVGDITNDFSATGIRAALAENDLPCRKMYSDIGIMQKLSYRMENGVNYAYTGAYSGEFTCIIKSADLITWEYVSQPDFAHESEWENATYVIGDKVFYFVRQLARYDPPCPYGFLTAYDLNTGKWDTPVLIEDCQSRGDFIFYDGQLYLFHAPIDREHIGIVKINTNNIAASQIVAQANMQGSCFYPFIQYFPDGELAMSYTVARKHIRLGRFNLREVLK